MSTGTSAPSELRSRARFDLSRVRGATTASNLRCEQKGQVQIVRGPSLALETRGVVLRTVTGMARRSFRFLELHAGAVRIRADVVDAPPGRGGIANHGNIVLV